MGKVLVTTLNVIQMILGLGLMAASIWYYTEVQTMTSLRNRNHYLLDYNVYWPQAIPFVFIFVAIYAVCVACCSFAGARKKSKSIVLMYIVFEVIAIVVLLVAAIIAFVFVESKTTEQFIVDTIYDAFAQSKTNTDIQGAYETFEKRLQCCGAKTPRDYVGWRTEFPVSCCDTYYHGWIGSYNIDCDFSSKSANSRFGCSEVAVKYSKIAINSLAAVTVFMAFIGIICLISALILWKRLRRQPRVHLAQHELETKRVLI